jgi:hypothetical protein
MPTITLADALIHAADDLTDAISDIIPPPSMTREAVDQLMLIFKQQAKKAKVNARTQRQRVLKEWKPRPPNQKTNLPPRSTTCPSQPFHTSKLNTLTLTWG